MTNEENVSENNDLESSSKIIKNLVHDLVDQIAYSTEESQSDQKQEEIPVQAPSVTTRNENNYYSVKWINFHHQKIPIILQNINGPCPLISICNVLLLRDQIHLSQNIEIISNESLVQKLADALFNIFVPRLQQTASNAGINYEQNVNDALSIFDKLQYGLDVNVKFSGCSDFEYTKEMDIFDLFSINLYHGWLIDPQQKELFQSLADKSYNQLVEISVSNDSENNHEKTVMKLLAEDFLKSTASQLTFYGLSSLYSSLKPHELAIFFRNNHFSTIYRHPENKCLYTLVTDNGYLNHKEIVWETLDGIEGAGNFCDSNFKLIDGEPKVQQPQSQSNNDYLLALSLQQQEEQQQQRQQSLPRSSSERSSNRQQSPKKKDKGCILM
ncbi:unnamed protein product [Brachionus calyciflorus]|uniref:Ubiquitin carboxyl-terminal hydrolase n=1 Tax=Brachionus calyciflorus TaxID=104777 RepID=A0A813X868_9BILA|nr:unnamed protein product [Brachionus calyciflorus]